MDAQLGFDTLTPICSIHERLATWKARRRQRLTRRGRALSPEARGLASHAQVSLPCLGSQGSWGSDAARPALRASTPHERRGSLPASAAAAAAAHECAGERCLPVR